MKSASRHVRRIGLFGGSFDPPHQAHLDLLRSTLKEFKLTKAIVVPSKYPPGKSPEASFDNRLAWTQKLFKSLKSIEVSAFEGSSSQTVFAKQIFSHFALRDPKATYAWILGEDNFKALPYWRDIESYAASLLWLVFPRSADAKPSGLLSKRLKRGSVPYRWTKGHRQVLVASHLIREGIQSQGRSSKMIRWVPATIRRSVVETYQKRAKSHNGGKSH